jgi:UDP-2,3-diacylglucosamine pyrophosphatase LpxH
MIDGALLRRHRAAGVLLDTNLLLLYVVGAHDRGLIPRFKRTAAFTAEDFRILTNALDSFAHILTTPHILTEVSNLAGQLADPLKQAVFRTLAAAIGMLTELQAPARELCGDSAFPRFGLTDVAILRNGRDKFLVLTDDFRLSQYLAHDKVAVVNFNHLRTYLLK